MKPFALSLSLLLAFCLSLHCLTLTSTADDEAKKLSAELEAAKKKLTEVRVTGDWCRPTAAMERQYQPTLYLAASSGDSVVLRVPSAAGLPTLGAPLGGPGGRGRATLRPQRMSAVTTRWPNLAKVPTSVGGQHG